jgi:hypothetical protein
MKNSWDYKHEDLVNIQSRKLKVGVGQTNSDKIDGYFEGILILHTLAANHPYLPAQIEILTDDKTTKKLGFEVIKSIEIL